MDGNTSSGAERTSTGTNDRITSNSFVSNSLPSQSHIALGPVGMNYLQHQLELQRQHHNANNGSANFSNSSNCINNNNNNNNTSTIDVSSNPNNPAPFNRTNNVASLNAMGTNSHAKFLHAQQEQLLLLQGRNLSTNAQPSAATFANTNTNSDNYTPWLQRIILNKITPLPTNLINNNVNSNTTIIASDNCSGEVRSNHPNAHNNDHQQQLTNHQQLIIENSQRANDLFQHQKQQGSTSIGGGTTTGASNIAAAEYMQQLKHQFLPSQPQQQQLGSIQGQQQQQQQQNLQQHNQQGITHLSKLLLAVNGLASSQIQLPTTQKEQQQQQPQQQSIVAMSSIGNHQMTQYALPTTTNLPPGAGLPTMPSLQQEQQQLLLLALLLQQQSSNNNNSAANLDLNALSASLITPEGIRLLNSFAIGQPVAPPQQQQLLSVQQHNHQHHHDYQQQQYQHNVSATAPTTHLAMDHRTLATTTATAGPQEDVFSNNQHSLFLSPQSQHHPQLLHALQPPPSLPLFMPITQPQTTLNQNKEAGKAGGGSTGIIPAAAIAANQQFAAFVASTYQTPSSIALIATTNPSASSSSTISDIAGSMLTATTMNIQAGTGKTVDWSNQHLLEKNGVNSSSGLSRSTNTNFNSNYKPPTEKRFPRILYTESDDDILGEYQTLLRQQLELFEADGQDVINGTFRQGRTSPIKLGQIGLRCRHCALTPPSLRSKGSVYFSQTIKGMYQIAQNMSKVHLCERCVRLPIDTKKRMVLLRSWKNRASGGRAYWIRYLRELGIYEDGNVLRARPPGVKRMKNPPSVTTTTKPAAGPPASSTGGLESASTG